MEIKIKKVLFVATVVKMHIMEFHIPYLKMLKEMGWETSVAAKNDYENPEDCKIPYCDHYYDIDFQRSPLHKSNIKAYHILKDLIDSEHYDVVHCHTPVGGALARLASIDARKTGTKVFYTAHGFHFFHGAPIKNWLIYYPIEKYLSKYTDVLFTINNEDYKAAKKFKAKKVAYIPGIGIDTKKFVYNQQVDKQKRLEFNLNSDDFVVLSVGELTKRKNHIVVLRAVAKAIKNYGLNKLQYVICGSGELYEYLIQEVRNLNIEKHVHFLGYRNDIPEICCSCDVFAFMSLQEGLPVALMEAMACGMPCVASNIRGNNDLIINEKNGLLIDNSADECCEAILKLYKNIGLRNQLASAAASSIKKYDIENVKKIVHEYYISNL
jgi:glycosyltransferase involved in cell wall biosynthesis